MYFRMLKPPKQKSFFLFGPRSTGKTTWIKATFPNAIYLDLLKAETYNELLANPSRLEEHVPMHVNRTMIVIDEVQRVPALLHEVHRLIEARGAYFALTGSSARKLKRGDDINLLAGRARTQYLYPLTAHELGSDFRMEHSLSYGHLPSTFSEEDPHKYLESYVATYLREEIQQEGLTRNLGAFSRFLESISFSQGQILNISAISRDAAVHRKVVEGYVSILEDLMLAYRVSAFTKKAKRRPVSHPKFYFFDAGVYRAIRPKGPLDKPEEIAGSALETLVFQELTAVNAYLDWGYVIHYWRSASGLEVDFVLYGENGIIAIEVKHTKRIGREHLRGLRSFLADYPSATAYLIYMGEEHLYRDGVHIMPARDFFAHSIEIPNPK
jgi:uncharacterized protein